MFEMISIENRIVTKYNKEFVSLIGIRNLATLDEIDPTTSELFKNELFTLNDIDDAKCALELMPKDFEGFVAVDKNFNRIKIKSDEYFKLARIKMLNEEDIFNIVVKGELVDAEFVHAFPEIEARIKTIEGEWEVYTSQIKEVFNKIKALKGDRKAYALEALKHPKISSALFACLDDKDLKEWICWSIFKRWMS